MKLHLAHRWLLAASLLSLFACGGGAAGSIPGSGGIAGAGGSTAAGGTSAAGGSGATGGGSATGGTNATGGAAGSGGATSTGGSSSSGTGGRIGTGGSTSTGGATGTGGRSGTGGSTGSGGRTATGGVTGTGGASATGGSTGSGGRTTTGGVPGTGGRGGTTSSGGSTGTGGTTHAGAWRIMPLGDSITVTTCYPQLLFKELTDKSKTNFVFVGSNNCNQICGTGVPNTVCEGQGGMWATNLVPGGANPDLMGKWFPTDKADVALMHFGTNDIWGTQPTQKILDAFSQIIDALRAAVPSVVVFVAQIIPMNPDNCSTCETRLEELNAAIPDWAAGKSTATSPVYPVDLWSALPKATYTAGSSLTKDGVHPEPPAAQKMADAWYAALAAKGIP